MKMMVCKNCGGHINPRTYKCEYCDTQYERERDPNILYVEAMPFHTADIMCGMSIPYEIASRIDSDNYGAYCHRQLALEFAKKIVPYMEMQVSDDFSTLGINVKARVKVVVPERYRSEVF